jgi:hypothetical protein
MISTPGAGVAYIPVPVDRLPDAYRVLAPVLGGSLPETEPDGGWTPEQLAELRQVVASRMAVRTMLDLCADRPDQWVSILEVERAAKLTKPKVRAGLAGLTMLLKARFGAKSWPVDWQWMNGSAHYRMRPNIATGWKAGS